MSENFQWYPDVFVCIPSYKSVGHLKKFLPQLLQSVPASNIIVVDDGSNDGTGDYCRKLNIDCLNHATNQGKGAALRTGFSALLEKGARWIITMDADGQHALADIPSLIGEIKKVPLAGIIIGKRAMKPGVMPPARILSNKITSFILTRYAHQPILDSQCGYRLYNSSFLQAITIEYNRFEMESEVILKAAHLKYPIRFVEVQTLYLDQTSHISHILDTFRWVRAVLKVHRTVSLR